MNVIETRVERWFLEEKGIERTVDFSLYSRVDAPDASSPPMTVTYYAGDQSGEWTTDAPIEFYTVKAGWRFALYWIDGGADSGFWTTEHLQNRRGHQPDISHLSTWNTVFPAPEPSTIFLLGAGLMGFAGYAKWRCN